MTETGVRLFDAAAVEAVATRLNEAMEKGRRQDRCLRQEVRAEVDQLIRFGPSRLPLASAIVVLLALAACGAWGFLWGVTTGSWVAAALFIVLLSLGVFLLDQVWLMQKREDALKAGLYVAATNQD
ncbi:hypothetical protein SAMN04488074_13428 [Lentzea albidocapillata subsp. violacea]|uniref:Uncharacterized protein n=1 Tax=Lentzea albidocapillata subsp. violacea TaxID=128104 RepID=A0A1G9YLZ1_9PSEU|nr:hypothetical protein [Lentzea albidocapillata]SDN09982.1 hypothetical protein SAMN04488074_13428 [Lentzea albidocapillata subsp. violacea]